MYIVCRFTGFQASHFGDAVDEINRMVLYIKKQRPRQEVYLPINLCFVVNDAV